MKKLIVGWAAIILGLSAPSARLFAQSAVVAGPNVNMVRGAKPLEGDPYLQRQVEPSIAVSTRNPCHLLAGGVDYRTVDYSDVADPLMPAAQGPGDAWLGVFKSFDCGKKWFSEILPGFPQDTSAQGMNSPLKGFDAGADPVVRAGPNGLIYYVGMVFKRGDMARSNIFINTFSDQNNKERGDTFVDLGATIVDKGTPGQFLDKPWMAVDIPRPGGGVCTVNGQTFPAGNVYVAWARFEGEGKTNPSKGQPAPRNLAHEVQRRRTHVHRAEGDCIQDQRVRSATLGRPAQLSHQRAPDDRGRRP